MKMKYKSYQERIDISDMPTRLLSFIYPPDSIESVNGKVYAVYKLEVFTNVTN